MPQARKFLHGMLLDNSANLNCISAIIFPLINKLKSPSEGEVAEESQKTAT